MGKTSWIAKTKMKPKYRVRAKSRCSLCGRSHAYLRKFGICRICLRERAHLGQIPGMRKASW